MHALVRVENALELLLFLLLPRDELLPLLDDHREPDILDVLLLQLLIFVDLLESFEALLVAEAQSVVCLQLELLLELGLHSFPSYDPFGLLEVGLLVRCDRAIRGGEAVDFGRRNARVHAFISFHSNLLLYI